MKNIVSAIILALAAVFMAACIHRGEEKTGSEAYITQLISEASAEVESQRFDSAMVKAIQALDLAEKKELPLQKVKALECIDMYVRHQQQYMAQKNDEILQEMETKFEVEKKEKALVIGRYRTALLILAVILALAALVAAFRKIRAVRPGAQGF